MDVCDPDLQENITFNYEGTKIRIDYIFTNIEHILIDLQIHFKEERLSDHYFVTV